MKSACPATINLSNLADAVARAHQLRDDSHPLGHVEAGAPEVDDVAAATELGGPLDHRRFMASAEQPIRERRASDARADDENFHGCLL